MLTEGKAGCAVEMMFVIYSIATSCTQQNNAVIAHDSTDLQIDMHAVYYNCCLTGCTITLGILGCGIAVLGERKVLP